MERCSGLMALAIKDCGKRGSNMEEEFLFQVTAIKGKEFSKIIR